jgi:phospholipid/cholesterol/gamma-HCH transport system permease protein
VAIDMTLVERLDTFGAWLLERLVRVFAARGYATEVVGLKDDYTALASQTHRVRSQQEQTRRPNQLIFVLSSIGESIASVGRSLSAIVTMLGALTLALLRVLGHPQHLRFTSLMDQLDKIAWRAVPIVLLITFLIGCIIAQQGIFHFRKFGADIYVVDMIGILVLRELGGLIVSIMVAGRSGSAYSAELGAMKKCVKRSTRCAQWASTRSKS